MIELLDKSSCSGCEACVQRCPKQCITMKEDELGFRYPSIDTIQCVECGACVRICPTKSNVQEATPLTIYACKNKGAETRQNSSSGGLFTAIATQIIEQEGIVFGVTFDGNLNVCFDSADTIEQLQKFQGSKYVQATVGRIYESVEKYLKAGRKVLFSGTSCQVAGLKSYLGREYDSLVTIDFICHGVPSQRLFDQFLKEEIPDIQEKNNCVVRFRDKTNGWWNFHFSVTSDSAESQHPITIYNHPFAETSYGALFLNNVSLRPSCYQCAAKSGKSKSDITMADFWGVWHSYPEKDDNKGITLAIINSKKGEELIPFDKLDYFPLSMEDAFFANEGYFECPIKHPKIELFYKWMIEGKSLKQIQKELFPIDYSQKVKTIIKSWLAWIKK